MHVLSEGFCAYVCMYNVLRQWNLAHPDFKESTDSMITSVLLADMAEVNLAEIKFGSANWRSTNCQIKCSAKFFSYKVTYIEGYLIFTVVIETNTFVIVTHTCYGNKLLLPVSVLIVIALLLQ